MSNHSSSPPSRYGMLAGLFLAGGLCFGSIVLARTWIHLKESEIIEVAGSTRKNVRSDLAVWTARVSVEDSTIQGAYAKLKVDVEMTSVDLDPLGDLVQKTDFRQVYAEVVKNWLNADPEKVLLGKFEPLSLVAG